MVVQVKEATEIRFDHLLPCEGNASLSKESCPSPKGQVFVPAYSASSNASPFSSLCAVKRASPSTAETLAFVDVDETTSIHQASHLASSAFVSSSPICRPLAIHHNYLVPRLISSRSPDFQHLCPPRTSSLPSFSTPLPHLSPSCGLPLSPIVPKAMRRPMRSGSTSGRRVCLYLSGAVAFHVLCSLVCVYRTTLGLVFPLLAVVIPFL